MARLWNAFFGRRALRFGLKRDDRSRFRNASFASFLASNNRRTLNSDFQDTVLRGRKFFRQALVLALIAGGAWVVLESAHAFSIFK
jgi:hypothetical protein